MFACQTFLQKICSNFYKEQKLFYGHLMKMITSSSKVTHKADLGLFPTLRKFSMSGIVAVCSRVPSCLASGLNSRPNQTLIL